MNQKGFVNITVLIAVIIVLGIIGVYFVLNWQTQSRSMPTPTPISIPGAPAPGPITVVGEVRCLPKKGSGTQTLECAIGLRDTDGRHYGLKNLSQHDPEYKFSVTGLNVEVSGEFSSATHAPLDKYDVVGIIDVASIKEVKQ